MTTSPATRRIVDDYEAWVSEVWPAFEAAADTGHPFTVDQVARKNKLPDPPKPQSQWGHLPSRLVNSGIMRHHDYRGSRRAKDSIVHVWIGIPEHQREAVARHLAEARKERAAARAEQRRAA